MSAQFTAAKAQAINGTVQTAPDTAISASEKAAMDKLYAGNNHSEELTPEALKAADDFSRGETPEGTPAVAKPDGVVAAEPETQKTPEEIAAEEQAAADAAAAGKTPEELAAEAAANEGKTQEELDAEAAAAAEQAGKTPEEIAAEEAEIARLAEEAAAAAKVEEDPNKIRIRIHRDNFDTEREYRLAVKATKLMNEFKLSPSKAEAEAIRLDPTLAAPTNETPAQTTISANPDVAALEAQYEAKVAEKAKAIAEYRSEDAAKLDTEVYRLMRAIQTAERKVEQAQTQAQTFDSQVDASIARAAAEFPDSMVKDHPLFDAIELALLRMPANDPMRSKPNFPELVAKQCADKLKIQAKSAKPAATTPSVTPPKPTAKPTKVAPISGKARTVTPLTKPEDDLDAALRKELGPKNAHLVGRAPPVM